MRFSKLIWLIPDPENVIFTAYARQFTALGCEVTLYPYRKRLLESGQVAIQEELLSLVVAHDVAFLSLFSGTFELPPTFCASLRARTPIVLWAADDELYSTRQTAYYAGVVDAIISSDYWGRGLLDQLGVPTFYLPLHNPDIAATGKSLEKDIDVSFVGNCAVADRQECIAYLEANGIKVETYGRGSANGYVSQQQYIEIIQRSRINLNFTRANFSADDLIQEPWRQMVRQLKGRPFEVAALGAFCLSEYAPHLDAIFPTGAEIGVFHNKQTLLVQTRRYLADPEMREAMADAAQQRVVRQFGMPECLRRLMQEMAPVIDRRRQRVGEGSIALPLATSFSIDQCVGALISALAMARKGRLTLSLSTFARLPGWNRPLTVIIPAIFRLLRQAISKSRG